MMRKIDEKTVISVTNTKNFLVSGIFGDIIVLLIFCLIV